VTTLSKGDWGVEFEITCVDETGAAINVSSAITKEIKFLRPDATVLTKPASFVGSGSDGKIKASLSSTDAPQLVGRWPYCAHIVTTGFEFHTQEDTFAVEDLFS